MAAIAFNTLNQAGTDPATLGAQFLPLDPSCVSDAIPAFFIGRNKDGFWVARDARGRIGGLFLSKSGALSFARSHSESGGCATIYPAEAFELDLRNMAIPLSHAWIVKTPGNGFKPAITERKISNMTMLTHTGSPIHPDGEEYLATLDDTA